MVDKRTSLNPKSGRVFHVILYNFPSHFDISDINETIIKQAILHSTIRRYAYIKHDMDVYTEKDVLLGNAQSVGSQKPSHWHVLLEVPNKCPVSLISKWFNVPENQVEIPNNRGKIRITTKGAEKVFIECVSYLDHSKSDDPGKYIYDPAKVIANFDWKRQVKSFYAQHMPHKKIQSKKSNLKTEPSLRPIVLNISLILCPKTDFFANKTDEEILEYYSDSGTIITPKE